MQGFLAHQRGAHTRQFAFLQRTETIEQRNRYHAVQHAITEKLQALVIGLTKTAVRQGLNKQIL
ncbi:hypothetical protein SDC9_201873 [bioreactor metagenome]|uniref:Uncharacterized protein n=1 Tax=bioreactor metagenome TaxID=1076179 RepID=A0A645J3Z1_9ZZZZ